MAAANATAVSLLSSMLEDGIEQEFHCCLLVIDRHWSLASFAVCVCRSVLCLLVTSIEH